MRSPLSPAEVDVVRLLAIGHSTKTAADKLGRSHKTIEFHSLNARRKLNTDSIAVLTHHAIRHKLIPLLKI